MLLLSEAEDSFLHKKAATHRKDVIFENNNTNKYANFKSFVKSNVIKFADSTDKIPFSVIFLSQKA